MKLSLAVVALLSVLGSSARLVIDNLAVKEGPLWQDFAVTASGTSCRVWVKNGNNRATSRSGFYNAPHTYGGLNANTGTRFLQYIDFPGGQFVSKYRPTYIWTSCGDALLMDYMALDANDGSRTWGGNNEYAWCLSTDYTDGEWFNSQSQYLSNWNVVGNGGCHSTLRLNTNGLVSAWNGRRPTFWENNGWGRRMLDAAEAADLPSAAEVNACVEDESRPEEECDDLVDQILNFKIEHSEGFHLAPQFPITVDDMPDNVPEVDVTATETPTDDRRVLNAVKKLLKL